MQQQRRRWEWRWRLALGVLASVVLASCGGGGDAPADPRRAGALSASQPGELLAYVKDRLRQRQQIRLATPGVEFAGGSPPPLVVSGDGVSGPVLRSGTTVQEAGIDEDDLIKTDGALIYTLDRNGRDSSGGVTTSLAAHRRLADGSIELSATLALPVEADSYPATRGMLLAESARRIAVLGERVTMWRGGDLCDAVAGCLGGPAILPVVAIESSRVIVQLVDAGTDGGLAAGTRFALEGRLIGSRLVGSSLVVVTSHAPTLAVDALPPDATAEVRAAALDALQASDVLPTLRQGDAAAAPLVAETDCYVQAANASAGIEITTISVFDLASAEAAPKSRCIVGGTEALYMSTASLVLATTRFDYRSEQTGDVVTIYPPEITTDLHKFALGADGPTYRGSGTVAGHLGWDSERKPYRISEHDGDLRVLTFTGETGWAVAEDAGRVEPSPATLTILRERADDQTLVAVSQLPNAARPEPLGKPGEQVFGVRFLGERAYVVTFRRVDPMYVLDLADPLDPKVAGVLEVPGFSDWLFPLADGLLLGVGRDADANGVLGGVKVALFDVRNPAQPALLAERTFGDAGSATALDVSAHGLNLLNVGSTARIALPMLVSTADATQYEQGLQRFEVDTAAATMTVKPMIPAAPSPFGFGLWDERSVQIGQQVYYLSFGKLIASDW